MTDAPERIWAFRWPHGGRAWREDDMGAPVYATPYIRLDPHEAAVAAARAEALNQLLDVIMGVEGRGAQQCRFELRKLRSKFLAGAAA